MSKPTGDMWVLPLGGFQAIYRLHLDGEVIVCLGSGQGWPARCGARDAKRLYPPIHKTDSAVKRQFRDTNPLMLIN
jgi:hypothetical protein